MSNKCLFCGKTFKRSKFDDGRKKYCSQLHQYKYWIKMNPGRARQISYKCKAKHRKQNREYGRKYFAANKEKMTENLRSWRRLNRAKTVQQTLLRRYRLKNIPGSHTLEEWEQLKAQYGFKCAECKEIKPLTRDHKIPVSKPGATNDIANIQPMCRPCNSRKFNHLG